MSNTLGTASGDWLSDDTGLGFRTAFLVIAGIMVIIVAAHYLTNVNTMLLFWLAFVLTRPLGAAGGDSVSKPAADGGLGWGTLWGSAVLFGLLVVLVGYQTYQVHRRWVGISQVFRASDRFQHVSDARRTGRPADTSVGSAR